MDMKRFRGGLLVVLMALAVGFYGCSGDDGKDGAPGPAGQDGKDAPVTASVKAESCAVCHAGVGDDHQAVYNSTKDASKLVLNYTDVAETDNGDGTYTYLATFTITDNGAPYAATVTSNKIAGLDTQSWNWVDFDPATNQFDTVYFGTKDDGSPKAASSTIAATDTPGTYTQTVTLDSQLTTGDAYGYIARTKVGPSPVSHVQLYDDVSNAGIKVGTWTYTSAVTEDACANCHGKPYLKHGYRGFAATGLDDAVACKNCHYDTRTGSDAAEFFGDEAYGYKASIMADTHASHNNVFPYPQAMNNCVACHPGAKLARRPDRRQFPERCLRKLPRRRRPGHQYRRLEAPFDDRAA